MKNNGLNSLYVCIISLIISCGNTKSSKNVNELPSAKINKIEVLYSGFSIQTPFRIECDNFNSYFKRTLKQNIITDKTILDIITKQLETIESKTPIQRGVDTRFKLKLYYEDGTIEYICGNEAFIKRKGLVYEISSELIIKLGIV
jgi:hypothetical protein